MHIIHSFPQQDPHLVTSLNYATLMKANIHVKRQSVRLIKTEVNSSVIEYHVEFMFDALVDVSVSLHLGALESCDQNGTMWYDIIASYTNHNLFLN